MQKIDWFGERISTYAICISPPWLLIGTFTISHLSDLKAIWIHAGNKVEINIVQKINNLLLFLGFVFVKQIMS